MHCPLQHSSPTTQAVPVPPQLGVGVQAAQAVGVATGGSGSGHTCVAASQTVTLVGKISPPATRSGVDGWPFVKLTLNTPPCPLNVPQPVSVHCSAISTKKTSPVGLTATPKGEYAPAGTGPFTLVRCPVSSTQLMAAPPP